jgi:hypothetical protein
MERTHPYQEQEDEIAEREQHMQSLQWEGTCHNQGTKKRHSKQEGNGIKLRLEN